MYPFNASRRGRKNQQCQLQCSNLASEPYGKSSRGQTILTWYGPRIGPEFETELRSIAFEILAGAALRKQGSHTDLLKCFGGPKHQ